MNISRVSGMAMLLVVVLRIAIGWQLFYEGIWKINTLDSPNPWTSAGYLKNSQGPMRNTFRKMAGDPDDLDWLDAEKVVAGWKDWQQRFTDHYGLDENQAKRLTYLIDGRKEYAVELTTGVPEEIDLTSINARYRVGKESKDIQVVRYDPEKQRLIASGEARIEPEEKQKLLAPWQDAIAADEGNSLPDNVQAYIAAIEKLYRDASELGYAQRVKAMLGGNVELTGNERQQRIGDIEKYRKQLSEYETQLARVQQDYQYDHLNYRWGEIQGLRSSLVGPIKAMDADLKSDAQKLLSVAQMKRGSVPEPWTSLRISDMLTIAGLTILGLLLIFGLFTRLSAVVAAFMLFSFYLAMPPLPGLPEPPGTEHSLVVNKNLIEVFALLAIAALPTGYWFGIDAFIGWLRADKDA